MTARRRRKSHDIFEFFRPITMKLKYNKLLYIDAITRTFDATSKFQYNIKQAPT